MALQGSSDTTSNSSFESPFTIHIRNEFFSESPTDQAYYKTNDSSMLASDSVKLSLSP